MEKKARRAFVRQQDSTDCGPACLVTILRYFGGWEDIERIREATGTGSDGTTLLAMIRAGAEFGLEIDGYLGNAKALNSIECPCILHVRGANGGYHFVVFFGCTREAYLIADPASGLQKVKEPELEKLWQSHALLTVRPSSSFVSRKKRMREKRKWLFESVREDSHQLILSVVLGGLIASFSLAGALFSQVLIDEILPNEDGVRLAIGLALVAVFLLAQNALTAGRQLILIRQAKSFNNRIIRRFLDTLLYLPFTFFASRRAGDLITRLNDTARLQRFVTYAVGRVVISILMLLTAFTFIVVYSSFLGLWILGGLIALGLCALISRGPIRRGQVGMMTAHAANESKYVDSMRGIEAIKVANAEPYFASSMHDTFTEMQDAAYRLGRIGISFDFAAQTLGLVLLLGVLGGGAALVLRDSLQIGAFVALIQMSNMLLPAAYQIAVSNIELQEASVAFDRVYQFAAIEPEYEWQSESDSLPSFHLLVAEKLVFQFPGRPPLLRDASLHVARGEIILLAGGTGSGKSTLLRILLRLYAIKQGEIRVNGRDWGEIDTSTWRRLLGLVPQEVQVFSGSVAENISMRPLDNEQSVRSFCEELGLSDVFETLPDGYATLLGEGGVRLSGGQQRLLALARAMYRAPQLLLVDEPVTGLDRRAAHHAVTVLRRRREKMATLIVSHRSTFLPIVDRAYVIESGRLRQLSAVHLKAAAARVQPFTRSVT